jgi:hypothetical protein
MEWWGWLSAGLGAVVLLSQGIKAIKEMVAPAVDVRKRLSTLEEQNQNAVAHFAEIEKKFDEQDATNHAIMKGLVAIINHSIDGNGIEGLKSAREDLLQHIIERG